MTPTTLAKQIRELSTLAEVTEVSRLLKVRWRHLQAEAVLQFSPGDHVTFVGRGTRQVGTVTKINTKSIGVNVNGRQWKVSPSLLSRQAF